MFHVALFRIDLFLESLYTYYANLIAQKVHSMLSPRISCTLVVSPFHHKNTNANGGMYLEIHYCMRVFFQSALQKIPRNGVIRSQTQRLIDYISCCTFV